MNPDGSNAIRRRSAMQYNTRHVYSDIIFSAGNERNNMPYKNILLNIFMEL